MAGTKISALSSLSTLADTTVVPVVASGVNYKMAGSVIKTSISQLTNGSNTAVLGSDGALTLTGAIKASGLNPTITNGDYSAFLNGSGLFSSSAFLASAGSSAAGNHGYSFTGDGGYDTGMFSSGDGYIQFYSNNIKVIEVNPTGQTTSFLGPLNAKQVQETFGAPTLTNAATQTFDCSAAQIFNINMGNQAQNFVANMTNINLPVGSVTTVSFVLNQGSTPYIISGVQFEGNNTGANGYTFTYTWQGSSTPAGVANKKDVIALNILCTAAKTYTVLAQLVSF